MRPVAVTVKLICPAGVALVVLTVRVAVWGSPVLVTDAGLNDPLTPAGCPSNATLRSAVQAVELPWKVIVIV